MPSAPHSRRPRWTIRAPAARSVQLNMSGPGVFAVAARAKIKGAAVRLSLISGSLVILLLLAVYRSPPALLLGLLPVATGALIGVACVALGFGAVHGITLGFGITLIGESVDYSVYFFIQSLPGHTGDSARRAWRQRLWPTIRLGMLTSVCGFASLLPAGFPGLAQLGAYSISGLIAAAAVTRFVLPELLPAGFVIRDLAPLGSTVAHLLSPARRLSAPALWGTAAATAAAALLVLYSHRDTLWNRELSSLSPVPVAQQRYDAQLRADLGAANVLDLVVVSGPDLESVLSGAERTAPKLESLIDADVIGGFDSPANYLPSLATQEERRASLPDAATLRENLRLATAGLALRAEQLAPFIDDVEAARRGGLIMPQDLRDTSLAAGFRALVLHRSDRWSALLPLHAANPAAPDIDLARVSAALAGTADRPRCGREPGAAAGSEERVRRAVCLLPAGGHPSFAGGTRGNPRSPAARLALPGPRCARDRSPRSRRALRGRRLGGVRRAAHDPAPGRNAADRRRGIQLCLVLRRAAPRRRRACDRSRWPRW